MQAFEETRDLNLNLKMYVYRLVPSYPMGDAFMGLACRDKPFLLAEDKNQGPFDWDVTGNYFISFHLGKINSFTNSTRGVSE